MCAAVTAYSLRRRLPENGLEGAQGAVRRAQGGRSRSMHSSSSSSSSRVKVNGSCDAMTADERPGRISVY